MWFEVILDFVVGLFPVIQETALEIMTWLGSPIPFLESFDITFYPFELMFGSALILMITYGAVAFIIKVWKT